MHSPRHSLTNAIRAALLEHGVSNARVIVDLAPLHESCNGTTDGGDSDGRCLHSEHMSITIHGAEGTWFHGGDALDHSLTLPKPLVPRRGNSVSRHSASRQAFSVNCGSTCGHQQTSGESDEPCVVVDPTGAGKDPQGQPHGTTCFTSHMSLQTNATDAPSVAHVQRVVERSPLPDGKQAMRKGRCGSVSSVCLKMPAPWTELKGNLVRASSTRVVGLPKEGECFNCEPPLDEAGKEVPQRVSALVSPTPLLANPQHVVVRMESINLDSGAVLPPVEEKVVCASVDCNVNHTGAKPCARVISPSPDAVPLNSKQRLLGLLQEQRAMEQQSAASRAKHEEMVGEAEVFLRDLQREKAAAQGEDGVTLPQISFRCGPGSQHRQSASCPLASHSSNNCIKVVKITMPAGGKARDEVLTQLSTSQEGAQHVSSKDRLAMLLREQENLFRQQQSGEEEYKKLLQQALAFHEQQKQLRMEQQREEEEQERREGSEGM